MSIGLSEYLLENTKFRPDRAKSVIEIETAITNGDFVITNDTIFDCKNLTDIECEDLEEAIKQYWDDGGIDWLKLDRKGTKFEIHTISK